MRLINQSDVPGEKRKSPRRAHEPTRPHISLPLGRILPIAVLALATASTAYPWGAQGHAAIGLVAEQRLSPVADRNIRRILGNDDLASIASWMDQLRGATSGFGPLAANPEARQFAQKNPHNDEWHYDNLPLGEARYADNDPFSRADDVVHEINIAVLVLEGRSTAVSPRIALYMIVHFVGDLHQPLHVATGYFDLSDPSHPVLDTDPKLAVGRENDKGGNELSFGSQRSEELHAYWDIALPEKIAGLSDPAVLAKLLAAAIPPGGWASPGDHHAWAEGWATESLAAARQAYAPLTFGVADTADGKLRRIHITMPADYDATAGPIARERLAKAAYHLAELLNAIDWPDRN